MPPRRRRVVGATAVTAVIIAAVCACACFDVAGATSSLTETMLTSDLGVAGHRSTLGASGDDDANENDTEDTAFASSGDRHAELRAAFERAKEENERRACAPSRVKGGRADKCAHVRETVACEGRLRAYLSYAYCDDEAFGMNNMVLPVVGLGLVATTSAYALGVSARTFFVPALETTATIMKLSPEAAGATLLALGNGAPDLYAQVSSLTEGIYPDLNLVVGSTLGSGLFIATVVLGVVLRSAPGAVVIHKDAFGQCAGIFAMSHVAFLLVMCLGKFALWHALGLFTMYVVYFCFTAFRDAADMAPSLEEGGGGNGSKTKKLEPLFDLASQKGGPDDIKGSVRVQTSRGNAGVVASATADMHELERKASFATIPIRAAMAITMPVIRAGVLEKQYVLALGFFAPLFFLSVPGNEFFSSLTDDDATAMLYNLAASAACFIIVAGFLAVKYKTTSPSASGEFISMFTFIQSICWMHLCSNELVMATDALARIIGADEEVLGVSVISWGDSIGDLVSCYAVSRAGQVTMAVVACFAGPVFNLLIGLASAIAFLASVLGDLPFQASQGEILLGIACVFTVLMTIAQLKHKSRIEFEMPKSMANSLFATYIGALGIYLLCEARLLFAQAR